MSIPEHVFQQLSASKDAVEVPLELGGGRMALFETIHQIHCVVCHPIPRVDEPIWLNNGCQQVL